MTTFIFRLARDASEQEIARIHDELSDRFPQHRFVGNGDGLSEVEFDIMVISDPARAGRRPAVLTDPVEIDLVKHAFFSMLDGWG
jgi:hypothetical protein